MENAFKKLTGVDWPPDSTHNMQWMFPPPQGTIDYLFEIQETGAA